MATQTKKSGTKKPPAPKYGEKGYDGKQPFESGGPRIKPKHTKTPLGPGAAGPAVLELAQLLDGLGYPCDISEGRNAFCVFGNAELAAVKRFRDDYGVREDPSGFGGGSEAAQLAERYVGPWTWEALLRASKQD